MALTQRQLAECAEETLDAVQAWDRLTGALKEVLAREDCGAEAKLTLAGHLLAEAGELASAKSEAALEHIQRTRKRNEKRAKSAREARERAREESER